MSMTWPNIRRGSFLSLKVRDMSELTTCNYCKLQSIRRDAKKKKKRVVMKSAGFNHGLGGYNVYLLDKGQKPNDKNFISWFMMITGVCVC
jgi:hypothetical protein